MQLPHLKDYSEYLWLEFVQNLIIIIDDYWIIPFILTFSTTQEDERTEIHCANNLKRIVSFHDLDFKIYSLLT